MAKKVFNSIEEYRSHLLLRTEQALSGPVADYIREKLSESAYRIATGPSSLAYGGISDISNMKANVEAKKDRVDLTVTDIAYPQDSIMGTRFRLEDNDSVQGTMFSRWIEYGEWMDLKEFAKTRNKAKRSPRKFVIPVQKKINANHGTIIRFIKREVYRK